MKFLQGVLLLAMLGVVIAFGLQNNELLTVRLLAWVAQAPISVVVAIAYVLGMFTGWTVLAFLRRSLRTITERRVEA